MEFRNEAHLLAVKKAFLRITADESWAVMRHLAEETIYQLEQKCLSEDDEEKAKTYRHDARGARKFWAEWLSFITLIMKGAGGEEEAFREIVMDSFLETPVEHGKTHTA